MNNLASIQSAEGAQFNSPGQRPGVRIIKKSVAPLGATEIEQRILRAIDDETATFADIKRLYREAEASEFETYVKIDWGTLQIMMRTRWPNAMRRLRRNL